MFEPQEKNPERLLPAGQMNPVVKWAYLLVINAVVFGATFAISYIFFDQGTAGAKIIAEIVTIITLLFSVFYWIKNKDK